MHVSKAGRVRDQTCNPLMIDYLVVLGNKIAIWGSYFFPIIDFQNPSKNPAHT